MRGREIYQRFLNDNKHPLIAHRRYEAMRETVAFMLANAVGAENAISSERIVAHLVGADQDLTVPKWQVEVLGPLRDHGVFICGGRGGVGMFLVDTASDGEKAISGMRNRLEKEAKRLKILEKMLEVVE